MYYSGSGLNTMNLLFFKSDNEVSNDYCTLGAFKGDFFTLSSSMDTPSNSSNVIFTSAVLHLFDEDGLDS